MERQKVINPEMEMSFTMPRTSTSVLDRIRSLGAGLSPKQRQLAEYVLNNYRDIAFMTSAELGSAAGVSEATVFRLAVALGYSGFPTFQDSIHAVVRETMSTTSFLPTPNGGGGLLSRVFASEAKHLNKVLAGLSTESFDRSVDLLFGSRRVLVAGHQASAALASHAGYLLSKVRSEVYTLREGYDAGFSVISELGPQDAAWVHVYPRYPFATVRLIQLLQERSVPIVLVTTSELSQLSHYATVLMPAPIRYDGFLDSLAPVMCLINAIILAITLRDQERTKQQLERFEAFVDRMDVFTLDKDRPESWGDHTNGKIL